MEIVRIQIHPYTLTPKAAPNRLSSSQPRGGALLRVWFRDLALPGHADLFPWVELGDLPLGLQLETLREGTPLPLVAASVLWAHDEAKALAKSEAFFPGSPILCHRTITNRADLTAETALAKLKISAEDVANWKTIEELFHRYPHTQWRLDFNGLFTDLNDAHDFWNRISAAAKAKIEFLEDPVCDELMADPDINDVFPGTLLATDRNQTPEALAKANVRVMKPVIFSPENLLSEATSFQGKIVITSSMDHPLGQLIALRGAQMIQKALPSQLLPAGLLTHDLYEPHGASHWVRTEQSCLQALHANRPGWGLTEELNALEWSDLA